MRINLRTVLLLAGVLLIVSNPCALAHTDVTVEEARDLIASTDDLTVVDVREPYEYCDTRGHIPGALNYPWSSGVLRARYEELPAAGPILVVCRSGGRSNAAASFLDSEGFQEVYDLLRGMSTWQWETAPCKYSGGSGTADDPYQIATAADLINLGETPEDYDKHFILTADIDLDPNLPDRKIFDKAVIAPDMNDVEEGFQGTSFVGVFDGNDHRVSHCTIRGRSYLGLFGRLAFGAEVTNLGLEVVDVNGTGTYVGSLGGESEAYITSSFGTGLISGNDNVGGLVGNSEGLIVLCYTISSVIGQDKTGGLVGDNDDEVLSCFSKGSVSGHNNVGGLVGENNEDEILSSYSTCRVDGNSNVGGLVGSNVEGSVLSSFSIGLVSGNNNAGGLVGNSLGGNVSSSFWDTKSSGQTYSDGGTGLETHEMQDIKTYLDSGWDFVDEVANGTCNFWHFQESTYPELAALRGIVPVEPDGTGAESDPYLISDANELGSVWFRPAAYYHLDGDIDLTGISWNMAVAPFFDGTFDGQGFCIQNLHVNGGRYLGLFGIVGQNAVITGLGLEEVMIEGTGDAVGGLAGTNYEGSVSLSYSTGSVRGSDEVGGLVGENEGSVLNCHSAALVSGIDVVGGLVGENDGSIASSYSTGAVTGNGLYVGGFVGSSYKDIFMSFWDVETSGLATSDGGTGKTTSEMQTASTFLEAGWDFMDETANGTQDIWWILEGQDYPRLWWEASGQ